MGGNQTYQRKTEIAMRHKGRSSVGNNDKYDIFLKYESKPNYKIISYNLKISQCNKLVEYTQFRIFHYSTTKRRKLRYNGHPITYKCFP